MYWFLYDSNGAIQEACQSDVVEWSNLTNAQGVSYSGALSAETTDSTAQDAWENPSHYTVENNKLIKTVTDAQLLESAQNAQNTIINDACNEAMAAGLTSSADGTSRIYLVDQATISDTGLARTITQANYPSEGIEAELMDGTYVTLDYSQMQTFSNDLQNFYLPLRSKKIRLLGQIKNTTTVADVQAVTWS